VVLHVLADTAQLLHQRHADASEMLGWPTPDRCRMCGEPIASPDRIVIAIHSQLWIAKPRWDGLDGTRGLPSWHKDGAP
jgi:hypothetical protein